MRNFDLGTLSVWAFFSFQTAFLCELYGYRASDDGTRSSRQPELARQRGREERRLSPQRRKSMTESRSLMPRSAPIDVETWQPNRASAGLKVALGHLAQWSSPPRRQPDIRTPYRRGQDPGYIVGTVKVGVANVPLCTLSAWRALSQWVACFVLRAGPAPGGRRSCFLAFARVEACLWCQTRNSFP